MEPTLPPAASDPAPSAAAPEQGTAPFRRRKMDAFTIQRGGSRIGLPDDARAAFDSAPISRWGDTLLEAMEGCYQPERERNPSLLGSAWSTLTLRKQGKSELQMNLVPRVVCEALFGSVLRFVLRQTALLVSERPPPCTQALTLPGESSPSLSHAGVIRSPAQLAVLRMPMAIVPKIPADAATHLKERAAQEYQDAVERYAVELFKEASRLEAAATGTAGSPEITSTMVKDADILLRRGYTRKGKTRLLIGSQLTATVGGLATGLLADMDKLKDAATLVLFLVLVAITVAATAISLIKE